MINLHLSVLASAIKEDDLMEAVKVTAGSMIKNMSDVLAKQEISDGNH
jgi:hypothetical protein